MVVTDASGQPVGSQVITVNGVAYVLNSGSIKKTSTPITRKSEFGIPNAETLLVMPFTGDAECQLATFDTVTPPIGSFFTIKDAGQVTLYAKVTGCSPKFQAAGEWMFQLEFNKQLSHVAA